MPNPLIHLASSAVILGRVRVSSRGAWLAGGAVFRSPGAASELGWGSVVLENSAFVGSPRAPLRVGRKTFFGHRCVVLGAEVGDVCEIGNASVLLPGSRLGDGCFLAEGTVVPAGASFGPRSVLAGRPARQIREATDDDYAQLAELRESDLALSPDPDFDTLGPTRNDPPMATLLSFRGMTPKVAPSARLYASVELMGDVQVGEQTLLAPGVKIVGDSHGPVRIGRRVQILENTVLHLLPQGALVIEDDVVIGPGCMIHGCHIRKGTVVEPGAIVCDHSDLGEGCLVRAGCVVKQRSRFEPLTEIDGFPGEAVGRLERAPERPVWAFHEGDEIG